MNTSPIYNQYGKAIVLMHLWPNCAFRRRQRSRLSSVPFRGGFLWRRSLARVHRQILGAPLAEEGAKEGVHAISLFARVPRQTDRQTDSKVHRNRLQDCYDSNLSARVVIFTEMSKPMKNGNPKTCLDFSFCLRRFTQPYGNKLISRV